MKITLLGTGLMGYPMTLRLIEEGHQVAVYNRTLEKAKPLSARGVRVMESPEDAIAYGEWIVLMLTDVWAIEEVLSPQEDRLLSGKTVIQMGTIAPSESVSLCKQVTTHGGVYVECPVLGSRAEAASGRLILMFGGTETEFERCAPVLKAFGPQPRYIGEVGKAAAVKLALNQLIAAHAVGFSLSLGLVEKNGVSLDVFMGILKESALFAPMVEKKLSNWRNRNYDNPNFPAKHLLKDVELIIKEAKVQGCATDVIDGIRHLLDQVVEQGLGDQDYSAVFNIVNRIKL